MAYARRTSRRRTTARKTTRRPAVRRSTRTRRSYFAAPAARRRSGTRRSAGGRSGTVRIEIVQAAPPALSPVTQALLDAKKVTSPRKAKF